MHDENEVDVAFSNAQLIPNKVEDRPPPNHEKRKQSGQSRIDQIDFDDPLNLDSGISPEMLIQVVYIMVTCLLAFELFFLAIQLQSYMVYAVAVFEFLITIAYSNNAVKTVFFHFSFQIIGIFFPLMLLFIDLFHIFDSYSVVNTLQYYEFKDLSNYIEKNMSIFYSTLLFITWIIRLVVCWKYIKKMIIKKGFEKYGGSSVV